MNTTSRRTAGVARLGAELLVIVLGVLTALWADSWVQAQQDRESEARYLSTLLEDIEETEGLLAESNAIRERMFQALTQIADRDLDAVPSDSVSEWVYDGLFLLGQFEPQLTTLRDIQSSDQLRLLTPSVRREVAELDRVMAFVNRTEDDFTRSQQDLVDPYLVQHTPLAGILTVADALPLARRPVPSADREVLQTDELRNAIAFKLSLGKIAAERRQTLSAALAELAAEVRARLAELG